MNNLKILKILDFKVWINWTIQPKRNRRNSPKCRNIWRHEIHQITKELKELKELKTTSLSKLQSLDYKLQKYSKLLRGFSMDFEDLNEGETPNGENPTQDEGEIQICHLSRIMLCQTKIMAEYPITKEWFELDSLKCSRMIESGIESNVPLEFQSLDDFQTYFLEYSTKHHVP
jgi:hypothetical protein